MFFLHVIPIVCSKLSWSLVFSSIIIVYEFFRRKRKLLHLLKKFKKSVGKYLIHVLKFLELLKECQVRVFHANKNDTVCSVVHNYYCFDVIGSGKTHHIRKSLKSNYHDEYITYSIDEAFDRIHCIQQLKKISHLTSNLAIYLNVNLILSAVSAHQMTLMPMTLLFNRMPSMSKQKLRFTL